MCYGFGPLFKLSFLYNLEEPNEDTLGKRLMPFGKNFRGEKHFYKRVNEINLRNVLENIGS